MPIRVLLLPRRRLLEINSESISLRELREILRKEGVEGEVIVLVNDRIAENQDIAIKPGDNIVIIEESPGG
ncbi:MoaD/ThiS family protein [Thermogladius sp. 4427co]|uniref:MoaD/ThiS family protein n=1 Tax=Thermogladius sp. 4427co TaxID=3450718 RepID=UPI003F7A2FBB